MLMSEYDRQLRTILQEYETTVAQTVMNKFARVLDALARGEGPDEIPVIGGEWAPEEERTPKYFEKLQQRVVRALVARCGFKYEAPAWAQPLPLTEADCVARYNAPEAREWNRRDYDRAYLVGRYGMALRGCGWDPGCIVPFEVFCADHLRPPGL
jgi:hypothetical protein